MKKKILPITFLLASLAGVSACGNNAGGGGATPADPLDLGESFNKDYYPKKEDNLVNSITGGTKMTIDVALNYEGTESAWIELANEYMRLCGNAVTVNIKTFGNTDQYIQNLQQQENNSRTDWDIVSGNLLSHADTSCYSLSNLETSNNPYMGNKKWKNALLSKAYNGDSEYMLNTEDLLTAWFVNTAATTAAGVEDPTPSTWDELIDMLDALQKEGYKYPLGLSLTKDSIQGSQFAWLLRIYGDYYFRQKYQVISKTYDSSTGFDETFTYDETNQEIENDRTCDRSYSRMLCTMMDEGSGEYYCGPTSDIYKDFIGQFYKLKKYINPSASTYTFSNIREQFKAQSMAGGKESPQVVIDYSGKGLQYLKSSSLKNNLDFFDYPQMKTEYVSDTTVTRDVGGNGGYLSLFNCHSKQQLDLNKDFLKFVLSPYGQSIYYAALAKYDLAPQGLTTVKNDLVVIPTEWKQFFQSSKVTNTGKADRNKYLTYGVLGLEKIDYVKEDKDLKNASIFWQTLLDPNNSEYTVDDYCSDWLDVLLDAWVTVYSSKSGWSDDAYKFTHFDDPNYIRDTMK